MKEINKKLSNISLRLFITLYISVVLVILLSVYSVVTVEFGKKSQKKVLSTDVANQCELLIEKLKTNNFAIATDDLDLNDYVESMATFFEGRVIVVDSEYRIIKDSSDDKTNSFIVSDRVIGAVTSGRTYEGGDVNGFYEYIYPIDNNGTIMGAVLVCANKDRVNVIRDQVADRSYALGMLVIVLGVGFAILGGYFVVKDINDVNNHMEVNRHGMVGEQLPVKGFTEIKDIAVNYNKSISKLLEIDSSRQEFVSNVSHELKTPITSMKVLADSLVQNEEADLSMYKEFMSDIVAEIDRESEIITDLLTLVKTDKKSAKINVAEVDINALLDVILKRVAPLADARGITVTYESYRDVVADVDEVKLTLALTNIIENAVKYNVENGWIKVTLNADHKNFHVKVADSGVGIPDDCKDKVFERFYRVDKARSRDTGGTGLGLSITRNIIAMHKGTIKLYSESGEGTTFTIKIPLKYVEE